MHFPPHCKISTIIYIFQYLFPKKERKRKYKLQNNLQASSLHLAGSGCRTSGCVLCPTTLREESSWMANPSKPSTAHHAKRSSMGLKVMCYKEKKICELIGEITITKDMVFWKAVPWNCKRSDIMLDFCVLLQPDVLSDCCLQLCIVSDLCV